SVEFVTVYEEAPELALSSTMTLFVPVPPFTVTGGREAIEPAPTLTVSSPSPAFTVSAPPTPLTLTTSAPPPLLTVTGAPLRVDCKLIVSLPPPVLITTEVGAANSGQVLVTPLTSTLKNFPKRPFPTLSVTVLLATCGSPFTVSAPVVLL